MGFNSAFKGLILVPKGYHYHVRKCNKLHTPATSHEDIMPVTTENETGQVDEKYLASAHSLITTLTVILDP